MNVALFPAKPNRKQGTFDSTEPMVQLAGDTPDPKSSPQAGTATRQAAIFASCQYSKGRKTRPLEKIAEHNF